MAMGQWGFREFARPRCQNRFNPFFQALAVVNGDGDVKMPKLFIIFPKEIRHSPKNQQSRMYLNTVYFLKSFKKYSLRPL